RRVFVAQEKQVRIAANIELVRAQPPQRHHHHAGRRIGHGQRGANGGVGGVAGVGERVVHVAQLRQVARRRSEHPLPVAFTQQRQLFSVRQRGRAQILEHRIVSLGGRERNAAKQRRRTPSQLARHAFQQRYLFGMPHQHVGQKFRNFKQQQ